MKQREIKDDPNILDLNKWTGDVFTTVIRKAAI